MGFISGLIVTKYYLEFIYIQGIVVNSAEVYTITKKPVFDLFIYYQLTELFIVA